MLDSLLKSGCNSAILILRSMVTQADLTI